MTEFPAVREDVVSWGRRTRTHCPNYKAIVNPETGDTYSIVSPGYQLVKHEDAIETVIQAIDKSPEFGKYDVQTDIFSDGGKMNTKITFPDIVYDIGKGDPINPTINIKNSYDTGWQYEVRFGAFRLVCSNGLVIGKQFAFYVKKHTQSLNQEVVQQILCKGMEEYSEQTEIWKKWADRVTTSSEYEYTMKELNLTKNEQEVIHQEVEVSSNLMLDDMKTKSLSYWMFYNIICQYITHNVQSQIRKVNLETKARKIF